MDGITAHAMGPELDHALSASRVGRISMSDRHTLHLSLFSARREKHNLTLLAHAARPSLNLTADPPPGGLNPPPAFVMLLRKHLRRAKITGIATPPWERVFIIDLLSINELGDPVERKLIFECMPRTANIVLLNQEDVIIGALRHIDHRINRVRETLPAHPYIPPPAQKRPDPPACARLSTEEILGDLTEKQLTGRTISQKVAGFSPVLGREVIARSGRDLSREHVAETLRALCREISSGHYAPAVYYDRPGGTPLVAHAVKLTYLPHRVPHRHAYQAVAEYSVAIAVTERFKQRRHSISKKIDAHIKRTQRKRQLHENDKAIGHEAPHDRHRGELILTWLHTIPKGSEGVTLADYRPDGQPVYCPLNPRLTAAENANRYFLKAKKKQRKLESARRLLQNDLDELAWLESLLTAAGYAESEEDLLAVEQEYHSRTRTSAQKSGRHEPAEKAPGQPASGKRRRQATARSAGSRQRKGAKGGEVPPAPRRFRSSDGFLITSGRNNLQNDRLLRKAGRDDLWFHAKHFPGSHVILSIRDIPPTPVAIGEAAAIAAWYSGAGRAGSAVEVDYCKIRQVKKIPGSRPGRVTYQGYQTLYITPADPSPLRIDGEEPDRQDPENRPKPAVGGPW